MDFLVNSVCSATFIVLNLFGMDRFTTAQNSTSGIKRLSTAVIQLQPRTSCPAKQHYSVNMHPENIENYNSDEWIKHAESECIKGLLAKFDQNPKLKTILLNTKDKILVECSLDRVWGTGCPLSQPDCLDTENWESPGLLGKLLMTVREKLKPLIAEQHTMPIPPPTTTDPCSENPTLPPAPMDTNHQTLTGDKG